MTAVSAYSFGLPEVVLLFAVLQTLMMAMVLSAGQGKNQLPNRLLCGFLVVLALILTDIVLVSAKIYRQHPHLTGLSLPGYFILAPLYYFYARSLLGTPPRKKDAVHLLPAIAGIAMTVPYYLEPPEAKISLMEQLTGPGFTNFPLLAVFLTSLISFQMMIYFYNTYALLENYEAEVKGEYAGSAILAVGWLKKLSMAFCLFVVIYYLAAAELFLAYIYRQGLYALEIFSYGIAAFIFLVAFHVYRHPELFALYTPGVLPETQGGEGRAKYEKTLLAPDQIKAYEERLNDFMAREQPYLDGELRLSQLAGSLDMPAHHLSQVINVSQNRSFFDFINQYRVNHAKDLLLASGGEGNILDAALASGFNSKASFNRVFKKETGTTPTAFQKQLEGGKTGDYLAR